MKYEEFKSLMAKQEAAAGIPSGKGWKRIKSFTTTELGVFDFRQYLIDNKIYYLDLEENGTRLVGFLVVDREAAETSSVTGVKNILTFIYLESITSIDFITNE